MPNGSHRKLIFTANGRVDDLTERELGSVRVEPNDDIVVGTYGTWTITYTVGVYGIDVGGGLKVGTRRMADIGTPQFDDPGGPLHGVQPGWSTATVGVHLPQRAVVQG